MEFLLRPLGEMEVYFWEETIDYWFFLAASVFLLMELVRYGVIRKLSWRLIGDCLTNYITLTAYLVISTFLLGALYIWAYFGLAYFAFFEIEITWLSIAGCVVLADLAYYWEHRFSHRVGLAWATHSVHHSSPYFNISVAYRFGPMDGFWGLFFHLPLILMGFNPFVVFFSQMFVQMYQTVLHTESIGKLPGFIEAVMNTPSHHRVHHGSNDAYLDKNYGGIFIIWDRIFGSFAREQEPVVYGLVEPINSINPFVAFFHGFARLAVKFVSVPGVGNKFASLVAPPGWDPRVERPDQAFE